MSSLELSQRIETSQSCLSRIENGSREPRLEIIKRLHGVLNLSAELLKYMDTGSFF